MLPASLRSLLLVALTTAGACHRHHGPAAPAAVLRTGDVVAVDQPLQVEFARPIDPASIFAPTLTITAVAGPGLGVPAKGAWRTAAARSGSDGAIDVVEFVPELPPPEPQPTAGGLQPATRYELRIAGGADPGALRFADGERLPTALTFTVTTRSGGSADVFASNRPGGPRLVAVTPVPLDADQRWRIGRLADHTELRLAFDQPLDPRPANVPGSASPTFQLRYDDPVFGPDTGVPVDVELEANTVDGAIVVLRPRGVLPTSTLLRLTIAGTLRDLFGEDRAGIAATEPATTVATEHTYAPLFDALLVDFTREQDLGEPAFPEAAAVVANGALRVADAFPGLDDVGDLRCSVETVLRTDVQQLTYADAPPRTFTGGVLHMRNLHIDAGVHVHGIGPNPLVLVVDGDAHIDGVLQVRGTDGQSGAGSYRGPGDVPPPVSGTGPAGGFPGTPVRAGAAGGAGGVMPNPTALGTQVSGEGPGAAPAAGGAGGAPSCETCTRSSGGGGGAMATAGDPWFPAPPTSGTSFVQRLGQGGYGCTGVSGSATRTLPGGAPGAMVVDGTDPDDDFWGRSYEPRTGASRVGELAAPTGGGGGGAGGNHGGNLACDPERVAAGTGGSGGGGGGAIVLQVRGTLTIGPTGRVSADGGNGVLLQHWDGPMGGGGGGAGGMVVLMAGKGIVLHTHGETFANRNYAFAVSADGGICRSGFWEPIVERKYPANGAFVMSGSSYDSSPFGGFGGMGIVQLMVPTGRANADGTNTVLDDAITIRRGGQVLSGAEKQRFLGWRGFRTAGATWVDDFGMPTATAGGQGDIRPAPLLLPVPFTVDGQARARSRWLPLGARHRRSIAAADGGSRGVVGEGLQFGSVVRSDGWLPFSGNGEPSVQAGPTVLPAPIAVLEAQANAPFRGRAAHRVRLVSPALGTDPERYAGYAAELRYAGTAVLWYRVVASDRDVLWLEGDDPLPGDLVSVQLRASFVEIAGQLPATYVASDLSRVPGANARLGFAFHRAPEQAIAAGFDPNRLPNDTRAFLFDLGDPALAPLLTGFGPSHLQWDVLLDGRYRAAPSDEPPAAGAAQRIALRRAFVPVRF